MKHIDAAARVSDEIAHVLGDATNEACEARCLRNSGLVLSFLPESPLKEVLCPITSGPVVDPVVASDGHTYSRLAIEEWFRICLDRPIGHKFITSPLTNLPMSDTLTPNIAIRCIAAPRPAAALAGLGGVGLAQLQDEAGADEDETF